MRKDWVTAEDGWPKDPTAPDPNCKECKGRGIVIAYPPPSGMYEVVAECFGCIKGRDQESRDAVAYLGKQHGE